MRVMILSGFLAITVSMGLNAGTVEIENSRYRLSLDPDASAFTIMAKANKLQFVSEGTFSAPVLSAQKNSVNDKIYGAGKALEIAYKNGDSGLFMLFDGLPYVLYQATLANKTGEERVVTKYAPFETKLDLNVSVTSLKSISTAGLMNVSKQPGGYMFMAVGNPDSRNGVVCAWLTTERGSGVVRAECREKEGLLRLKPHIDYGDLRIPKEASAQSEILLIGYVDDVRLGLEQYADAVAKQYNIKLRPQPGVYCTWYHAKSSDEERILKNAKFAGEHLKPFGLEVMQIDDRWQGDAIRAKKGGKKHNGPIKDFTGIGSEGYYKSGMKAIADNLKAEGFTPGIWFIPFAGTFDDPFFADKQDLFYKVDGRPYDVFWGGTGIDMTNPKSQAYLRGNIKRFSREWGFKYFKMDGLYTGLGVRTQYPNSRYRADNLGEPVRFNPLVTPVESYRNGLKIVRETAGNDVFFLGCSVSQNMRSFGASFGLVDAMRVGPDNGASWEHWKKAGKLVGTVKVGPIFSGRVYFLHNRVWYNDPDPIYVRATVPIEQVRAIASWVTLSGHLNATSEDYYDLPAERLDIIRRTIPAHGCMNVRPVDFLENEPAQIWLLSKKIGGLDHHVVGLYSWHEKEGAAIDYSMEKMGLDPDAEYCGFDYWANEFVKPFKAQLKTELPAASCRILSLRKVVEHPQIISTSRHITQGVVDLISEKWDDKAKKLNGVSRVVAKDPYEVRIVAGKDVKKVELINAPQGATADFKQEGDNVRVTILSSESGDIHWNVCF